MNFIGAIIIYIVFLAIIFLIARFARVNIFSALVLSLILADVIFITLYTPPLVAQIIPENYRVIAYQIIQVVTIIVILTYLFERIFTDRKIISSLK